MVKVGDTVVSVCDSDIDITIGNEYVVTAVYDTCFTFRDDGGCKRTRNLRDYRVIPSAPPQKIQQDGYEYELVGPVKPDWLVDGAWVVDKETGRKYRVSCDNGVYTFNNGTREVIIDFISLPTRFRPHTVSDWKWGDWAMYEGKRVFVMSGVDEAGDIYVSYPDILNTGYYEVQRNYNYVPASKLTPTF